jgi:hypothetical protein
MAFKSDFPQYNQQLEQAILRGMDKTLGEAVAPAKVETPVITGTAQGSIKFTPSIKEGTKYVGYFGSYDVDYFIWLEIGARGRAGHHMLRRAADITFPKLNENIRSEMR